MTHINVQGFSHAEVTWNDLTEFRTVRLAGAPHDGGSVTFFLDRANARAMLQLGEALIRDAQFYLSQGEGVGARGESPPLYIAN